MDDINGVEGYDQSYFGGPESADGTLVIIVCRAKHLPNRRKLDKQSPYVALRLATTAKKTPAHFRAGQTPEWTHEMRFQLTRDRKPIIRVDVLDETKNEPTPIGTTEIDCSVIFQNPDKQDNGKYIYDRWFDLTLNGRRAGMIYLEMTFYPTAPLLPPKVNEYLTDEVDNYGEENYHHSDDAVDTIHRGSYSSQLSAAKNFAAPPKHPRFRARNVSDDIFVSSNGSDKSTFSKGVSLLKNSYHSSTSTPLTSSHGSFEERDASPTSSPEQDQSPDREKKGKWKFKKLTKLKDRFQAKEPITALWQHNENNEQTIEKLPQRLASPISEYQSETSNNIYQPYHQSPPPEFKVEESHIPTPPPHLVEPMETFHQSALTTYVSNDLLKSKSPPKSPPKSRSGSPSKSPTRKPPPQDEQVGRISNAFSSLNMKNSIPFSADTIGVDCEDEGLPTQVFMLDKPVRPLKNPKVNSIENDAPYDLNPDEIDPRYYAPTPDEHFTKSQRLEHAALKRGDLAIDLRTNETGYLGDGKFSPSIFDRVPHGNENSKPSVPPKIPKGLSEAEYYVLDKKNYLQDLNGRRL